MDYTKIILEKGGQIIKDSEDPFDDLELKCENGHTFFELFNDIIAGKWCKKCEKMKSGSEPIVPTEIENDSIKIALDQLKMKYEPKYEIDGQVFNYVINHPKTPFIVEKYENFNTEKFKLADKRKFGMIIIKNTEIKDLGQEIWKAFTLIKEEEKEIVYIGENKDIFKHTCTEQEVLGNNGRSFVKSSPLPWPEMVKIAVGYTRVSTEYQVKDGHSLEAQGGDFC